MTDADQSPNLFYVYSLPQILREFEVFLFETLGLATLHEAPLGSSLQDYLLDLICFLACCKESKTLDLSNHANLKRKFYLIISRDPKLCLKRLLVETKESKTKVMILSIFHLF